MAIVDLGSNTFRLVAFAYEPAGPFTMTDEIRETVRLSAGATDGRLHPDAIARGVAAARMYAAYCSRTDVDAVLVGATSAIRDAVNRAEVLEAFAAVGLPARVLSTEDEAYYGYLGVVNSMDVEDAFFLDVGGGSAQVGRITRRTLERSMSEPLGAVRMTEAFHGPGRARRAQIREQRRHVLAALDHHPWIGADGLRLVGTGGTVRTLSAMAQRATDYPLGQVHGYLLGAATLDALIDEVASRPVSTRQRIPGLKADRADIILAGAVTIRTVMDRVGVDAIEICGQGLREGMFYEHYLAPARPPLVPDVRRATVRNLAGKNHADMVHAEHVARLALELFDGTARAGLHEADPVERELLWAAAMLHDVGVVVDYHDHHKHGFYLVLNGGLPGFTHRELVIISLLVRAHRKTIRDHAWLAPVLGEGDDERILRMASCLRLAEQLERDRTQQVVSVGVERRGRTVHVTLLGDADHSVALWSAAPEAAVFERAFGARLRLSAATVQYGERQRPDQPAVAPGDTGVPAPVSQNDALGA